MRPDALGRTRRRQHGHGRHRVSQDARRLRHASAGFQNTGRPSTGGVILTASGLTFVGGTDDFRFRAFATATGEQALGDQAAVIDRGDASHVYGRGWAAVRDRGEHGRQPHGVGRHQRRDHRLRVAEEVNAALSVGDRLLRGAESRMCHPRLGISHVTHVSGIDLLDPSPTFHFVCDRSRARRAQDGSR